MRKILRRLKKIDKSVDTPASHPLYPYLPLHVKRLLRPVTCSIFIENNVHEHSRSTVYNHAFSRGTPVCLLPVCSFVLPADTSYPPIRAVVTKAETLSDFFPQVFFFFPKSRRIWWHPMSETQNVTHPYKNTFQTWLKGLSVFTMRTLVLATMSFLCLCLKPQSMTLIHNNNHNKAAKTRVYALTPLSEVSLQWLTFSILPESTTSTKTFDNKTYVKVPQTLKQLNNRLKAVLSCESHPAVAADQSLCVKQSQTENI